jgi:methylglutaconyl-CoA hydratase
LALTGRVFDAHEASAGGLVERVAPDAELETAVRDELNGFLQGSPAAQSELKRLLHHVTTDSLRQGPHTAQAIATMRTSPTGQAGLAAFFAKQPSPWTTTLAPTFRLED